MPDIKESVRKMKLHSYKNLEQKGDKPAEAPIMFVSKIPLWKICVYSTFVYQSLRAVTQQ